MIDASLNKSMKFWGEFVANIVLSMHIKYDVFIHIKYDVFTHTMYFFKKNYIFLQIVDLFWVII